MKANAVHATLFALLLAACSSTPEPKPGPGPRTAEPSAPVEQPADPVDALLARASRAPDRDAASLRIDAAARAIEAGQPARASQILGSLGTLDAVQRARAALLRARIGLSAQDPAAALAVLNEASQQEIGTALPRELEVDLARGRADALLALGRPLDAAREQGALQPWLADDAERIRNARDILGRLSSVPLSELEQEALQAQSEDWRAWVELSMAARDMRYPPATQQRRLQDWFQRYAGLAALDGAAAPLVAELRERIAQPARTAVLLPLSGRASPVGQAVLQGYLAEYYRQLAAGEPVPPVAVLDTAGTAEGFAAAYQRAVADGATLVTGPLLKEELAAFTGSLAATVPTLALNFLEGPQAGAIPGVRQFGIDAGDELSQLAASARAAGYRRAVVLADGSPRAERLVADFEARWRAQGGDVIDTLLLRDLNDYRASLERTMLLDRSHERAQALNRLLGLELQTEPRRRGDLDLLVMLAEPVPARSIRSLLSFLYAGDLPLWGTSLSNAGGATPEEDLDLETLRFVDMPWFSDAEAALRADATGLRGGSERLFALGADACRLQSRLTLLDASATGAGLGGATGELTADAAGRIHRRSEWYVFRQGHVRPEAARARIDPPTTTPSSTEGDDTWPQEGTPPPTSDEPPRIAP